MTVAFCRMRLSSFDSRISMRHWKEWTLQPSTEDAGASGDACHPRMTDARCACIRVRKIRMQDHLAFVIDRWMSSIVLVEHGARRVYIVPRHGSGWQRRTLSAVIRLTNQMIGRGGTQVLPAPIILVVRDGASVVFQNTLQTRPLVKAT